MDANKIGPPQDHTENHRPKKFSEIKGAILDTEGVFKYIQIDIKNQKTNESKVVIRGWRSSAFHADILAKFEYQECQDMEDQLTCSCPGGGRIEHTNEEGNHKIHIYGYSQGFGQADHQKTQDIIA